MEEYHQSATKNQIYKSKQHFNGRRGVLFYGQIHLGEVLGLGYATPSLGKPSLSQVRARLDSRLL